MKKTLLVFCAALIASSVAFAAGPWKYAFYVPAPHPYFEAVKVGVDAFAKEYGIPVKNQVGPDWNMDSENTGVLALAADGYNLFSIYPADVSAANGLYSELTKKGAFVINEGGPTSLPTPASFFVSTNTKGAATQAAEYVIGKMGKKGTLLNTLELLEDGNTKTRRDAILAVAAKYPQVKVMEIAGIHNEQEAIEKIEGAVAAAGGFVDGIITTGYVPTVALSKFLTDYEAKSKRHIHGIGIDDDPVTLKAITDGYLDATVAQNPYGHGYLSMLALKYLSEGWKPRADGYFVDAGIAIVEKGNVTSYAKDLQQITAKIKADMTKKYLTK